MERIEIVKEGRWWLIRIDGSTLKVETFAEVLEELESLKSKA